MEIKLAEIRIHYDSNGSKKVEKIALNSVLRDAFALQYKPGQYSGAHIPTVSLQVLYRASTAGLMQAT